MNDLQQALGSIARVHELLQMPRLIRDGPTTGAALASAPAPDRGWLEVDDVSFAYGDGPPALRHVSFRLAPGRVLGVLGRTGSGKSTLARLLFRFYDPTRGVIRLAGRDVRELRLANLRRRVGLVTQDVVLFQASVRDNLAFFDAAVSDEKLSAGLDALGLGGWLRRLPRGLDTPLGPGGAGLSAGEAQLLALGRILLRDPEVVVLDEAASRLDPATALLLEAAIGRLLHGRTGIIVAHRLATVARADDVLILDDGAVAEYGPRAALAGDTSTRYAALLRAGLVPA
jgi:ABC-type multidrug transport system fused ATPase/permease subunit